MYISKYQKYALCIMANFSVKIGVYNIIEILVQHFIVVVGEGEVNSNHIMYYRLSML